MLAVELVGGNQVAPRASSASSTNSSAASPEFSRVSYPGVWPGVTASYSRSASGIFESSYAIEPALPAYPAGAARPVDLIRLRYNRPVRLNPDGSLTISFDRGEMRESAPVAWQERAGRRIPVDVAFRSLGDREIGFHVGGFDPLLPLVIDPTLTWNTFLGGSGDDTAYGIAVDGSGNVYVSGYSNATWGSPRRAYTGDNDAFAAKLDSSGNLVWNTFLGSSNYDYGRGIAVDSSGNVYVAGTSRATWGSPKRAYTSGADAFAAKLDSNGNLTWHTFLGGSAYDYGTGVDVDGDGNVLISGYGAGTWGAPVRAYSESGYDAFAAKMDSAGNLSWNTFLGASGDNDYSYDIAVDGSGNAYVGGWGPNWGSPVRAYSGGYDAFVAKLDSNGSLAWNTFMGGSLTEYGYGIDVNDSGAIFLSGYSTGTWGAPVRAFSSDFDVFVAKIDADGNLTWNTFLGGSGPDYESIPGVAADGSGGAFVVGYSSATWGSPDIAYAGGVDVFAAKLDSAGELTWHVFLGSAVTDFGAGAASNGAGSYYVSGYGVSWGAPVRAYTGGADVFAAKLEDDATAIKLGSFKAEAGLDGIELTWLTASEPDNVGFHLWRAAGENAPYERITPALIPARGDAVSGAAYAYLDSDVVQGQTYLYRLEDVDTAGRSEFHGPVTVVMGRIELLGPENGLQATIHAPVRFAWDGGPFVQFRVEYSADADFTQTGLSLPADWQSESYLEPSKTDWNRIRAAANESGILYWRVRGKTLSGAESTSASRWLRVR